MHSPLAKWALIGVAAATLVAALCPETRVLARSDAQRRGQELFATKGCAHCHGPNGVGGGKGPDLQLVRKRRSKEWMVSQIHDGGKEMPPFGDELTSQDIDDLVTFLRAKRRVVAVPNPAEQEGGAGSN